MSPAVTSPSLVTLRSSIFGSLFSKCLNLTFFKLRTMSVTSSTTPGRLPNSCWAPLIFTEVIEAPSNDDRRTLRREFPTVCP